MTAHLGAWVSALADGQLDPAAAERALAHVATCDACAAELQAARAAREAVAAVDDVQPPSELTWRLLGLPASVHTDEPAPHRPAVLAVGRLGMDPVSLFAMPSGGLRGDVAHRRPWARIAGGSLAGLGALAAMLFVLGDEPSVVPVAHPAEALSLLGQAAATPAAASAPASSDAQLISWMRDNGWVCPDAVPDGLSVTGVRLTGADPQVLEVDLAGEAGTVVVTEREGRLDLAALGTDRSVDVDGRTVHVLSREPWHGVWQAGSTVVEVVADVDPARLQDLVGAFPAAGYDDGVTARIGRGWNAVASAVEGR